MVKIVLLILGVLISVIGIVNIMGNISTIHSYNRRKVKEEDIPKYGRYRDSDYWCIVDSGFCRIILE